MPNLEDFYIVWNGSLNMGDTPGVFYNAQFAGLILQIPVSVSFHDGATDPTFMVLRTTDVEIFGGARHPVYWDWHPGEILPSTPIGYIDDTDPISGKPEYHLLTIPAKSAFEGKHSITVMVNPESAAGLKDDFVLEWMGAHNSLGVKLGW